jgi:DNA-binding transcriptional MerR regulator
MDKSPEAFRTISEVAESLETPAHVLRFWESRFPQIKPVKRAGGRRYYRPADVALLGGIRHLLHDEGMTIRGVQKILREQGVRHVAAMAAGSEGVDFDSDLLDGEAEDLGMTEPETAEVVALEPVARAPAPPQAVPAEVVQLRALPELPTPMPVDPVPVEDVPEAGHVWVEDEPEMELAPPTALFPKTRSEDHAPLWPGAGPPGFAKPPGSQHDNLSEGFVVRGTLPPTRPTVTQDSLPLDAEDPMADLVAAALADVIADVVAAEVADAIGDSVARPAVLVAEVPERDRAALQLSGIAARLRALPRPTSPEITAELLELHSRLGLLHAQMAEAQRTRR